MIPKKVHGPNSEEINDKKQRRSGGATPQADCKIGRPPLNDTIEINTDASFNKERGVASAGIVARNKFGQKEFGITKRFAANSSLVAEALVLRETAAIAINFGIKRFILENDNLDLIKACRSEITRGEINSIVLDIQDLKKKGDWCGFTWVARAKNSVAHHIAQLAAKGSLTIHWRWNHPSISGSLDSKGYREDQNESCSK